MGGYTAHIGTRGNCIKSTWKLSKISKHNGRKFESNKFDGSVNEVIIGSDNLHQDVKDLYHQEFDAALLEYNQKQTRDDRKIKNYFDHLANAPYSKNKQDIAVEMIVQCEDMDFWQGKDLTEQKKMTYVFKNQLKTLQEELPNFKIANATIHYDEASPHMHIVGVPVRDGCKKGLSKQVSKRDVFTPEILQRVLQGVMWDRAEKGMRMNFPDFGSFFPKVENEPNRPKKHLSIADYKKLKADQQAEKDLAAMIAETKAAVMAERERSANSPPSSSQIDSKSAADAAADRRESEQPQGDKPSLVGQLHERDQRQREARKKKRHDYDR